MRSLLLFVDCSSLPAAPALDPQLFLSRKDTLLFPFPPFAGVDNDGEPVVLEGGQRLLGGHGVDGDEAEGEVNTEAGDRKKESFPRLRFPICRLPRFPLY